MVADCFLGVVWRVIDSSVLKRGAPMLQRSGKVKLMVRSQPALESAETATVVLESNATHQWDGSEHNRVLEKGKEWICSGF